MKFYKIKNKEGLYSNGGVNITFGKVGKLWKNIGPLRSHIALTSVGDYSNLYKKKHPYEDCNIVELEFNEINSYPAIEELIGCVERKKKNK